jgi:hypothetical protein
MPVCEKFWADAAWLVVLCDGSQVDRYEQLGRERKDTSCAPEGH